MRILTTESGATTLSKEQVHMHNRNMVFYFKNKTFMTFSALYAYLFNHFPCDYAIVPNDEHFYCDFFIMNNLA